MTKPKQPSAIEHGQVAGTKPREIISHGKGLGTPKRKQTPAGSHNPVGSNTYSPGDLPATSVNREESLLPSLPVIEVVDPSKDAAIHDEQMRMFRERGHALRGRGSNYVIDVGLFIEEFRPVAEKGEYLKLIEEVLDIEPRMSQHYTNAAAVFAGHREFASHFDQTKLYFLSAPCRRDKVLGFIHHFELGNREEAIALARSLIAAKPVGRSAPPSTDLLVTKRQGVIDVLTKLPASDRQIILSAWSEIKIRDLCTAFGDDGELLGDVPNLIDAREARA